MATIVKLRELGIEPLFPNPNPNAEAKDLADTLEEKARFAYDHFDAIRASDAVYFILPEGYMGTSSKIDVGFSHALNKPIYYSELTNDLSLDHFPKAIISLDELERLNSELK